ncbi:MAG: DnaD domain protein [Oscillospiraceae bacterium]|jgi:DnaD/phage-associated family protein|nr:DnaD domain protein [Oscillospiraceae bacterium]
MSYTLRPHLLASGFFVPAAVADEHLIFSSAVPLKVLLLLLREGAAFTEEKAAAILKQPVSEISDALAFWEARGVLLPTADEQSGLPSVQAPASPPPAAAATASAEKPLPLPTPPLRAQSEADLCARLTESPALTDLFGEAERILGRTLTSATRQMLLHLHDGAGLPAEVILMLLQHCKDDGKTGTDYIQSAGIAWGEQGIDSIEKADERIEQIRRSRSAWGILANHAGIQTPKPTRQQEKYLHTWCSEWGFSPEMVCEAYDEMANHIANISFAYMDKTLRTWHETGVHTMEELTAYRAKPYRPDVTVGKDKKSKPKKERPQTSYDMEEYMAFLDKNPVYTPKRKR